MPFGIGTSAKPIRSMRQRGSSVSADRCWRWLLVARVLGNSWVGSQRPTSVNHTVGLGMAPNCLQNTQTIPGRPDLYDLAVGEVKHEDFCVEDCFAGRRQSA